MKMLMKMGIMSGNTRTRKRKRHQNQQSQLLLHQKQNLKKNLNQPQKNHQDAERGQNLSPYLIRNPREERGLGDQTEMIFSNK